jgi:glycosyltransferase involved in cell wall biosynthesis
VAWLGVQPTPYNMPLLEFLQDSGRIDLRLFFCGSRLDQPWEVDRYQPRLDPACRQKRWEVRGHYFNPAIVRCLWRDPWDAVVVCGYGQPTMQAAILSCLARRIPFILQGDTHSLRPRSAWKRAIKRMLVFPVLARCHAALGLGILAKRYWESMGIPRENVFVVPFTPHLGPFRETSLRRDSQRIDARRHWQIPDDRVVGIYVGRLVALKQVAMLLEAACCLPSAERPHLILVGDGPERPRLQAMTQRYGLSVTFTGFLQNSDIAPLYAAADFFVLPSEHEAWGIVVAEAAAAGLPLILSDQVGAAYDLLDEDRNGFMVRHSSVVAWRKALERCLGDRHRLLEMGKRSCEIVRDWTCEQSARRFFLALQRALPGMDLICDGVLEGEKSTTTHVEARSIGRA